MTRALAVRRLRSLLFALALMPAVVGAETFESDGVVVETDGSQISINNGLVERVWSVSPFTTVRLTDLREGGREWSAGTPDFTLVLDGATVPSTVLGVTGTRVDVLSRGGLRLVIELTPLGTSVPEPLPVPQGLRVWRTVEAYPGVAGLRAETLVETVVSVAVSGYHVEELGSGAATAAIHAFRAGADWRDDEDEWPGPPLAIGDAQPGSWRKTTRGGTGEAVSGTAQWMSLRDASGRTAALVLERNDYASSWMSYDGERGRASADFSRDVVYIGPFEESGHVGNPTPLPARHRVAGPFRPLRLAPVFTGFGVHPDDAPWQHFKYLEGHRMPPYRREVVFNSNGVDADRISTGAKDDMDMAAVVEQAAIAREIGVETFVLDDGWQARSGDWCPDSPTCPEPRWDGTPDSKFRPRFPDASFAAVRDEIAPMNLGLWMTPMHFHPSSGAFRQNPQWACLPVSLGLVAVNLADPESGSNEAGIGTWNPEAIGTDGTRLVEYIEARIRKAIDEWGVRYFKFDFLVWLDCAGVDLVDAYEYRESFLALLDRLIRDHPDVTFEIDETNDYRLFPFESVARGPSWYQNGSPEPRQALHASWTLSPFVPTFSLGRNALRTSGLGGAEAERLVDYRMATALPSHMTFFSDLTGIPTALRDDVREWTDWYRAHREDLSTFTYPLLPDPEGTKTPISGDNWVALQPWKPEARRGALLVYRQDAPEASQTIRLRNVPAGSYRLVEFVPPNEIVYGTFTAAELTDGIPIGIPMTNAARVFRIEPAD